MRISMCVGQYAAIPYYIPGLEIPVYSLEELCFCLQENAFLLDGTLMRDELADWIDRECGVRELAAALHPLIHKKGSLSSFVTLLMEYVGFYDSEEISRVAQVLRQGAGLSAIEKRKSRIDYLVQQKKYPAAIRGYNGLLARWGEMEHEGGELPAGKVKAAILHNRGVALAGMMFYGDSADSFMEAYRADGAEEHLLAFLASKRLELSEKSYISFVAEQAQNYEDTLELEKRIERLEEEWKQQPEYRKVQELRILRGTDRQRYYEESGALARTLKNSYRSSVSE